MKLAFKILAAIIITSGGLVSYAQDCSESIYLTLNCKMEGSARVIHRLDSNKLVKSLKADTHVFLLGDASDLKKPDVFENISNDVLVLYTQYGSIQNLKPPSIGFTLKSFSDSNGSWKYKQSRRVTINVDKNIIYTAELSPQQSVGLAKSFSFYMDLIDFRKIAEGKSIIIKFEDTEVELKPEQIKPFIDLYKTTEKLNPRPAIQLCNSYRCIY